MAYVQPRDLPEVPDTTNDQQFKIWTVSNMLLIKQEVTNHIKHDLDEVKETLVWIQRALVGAGLVLLVDLIWNLVKH